MNFLAHYYFDASHSDVHFNFGLLLPDLVRNFIPGARLPGELQDDGTPALGSIRDGCIRHKESDEIFHKWEGFEMSMEIGNRILKRSAEPLPRYYFLSHILSELVLDKILLNKMPDLADRLYADYEQVQAMHFNDFLSRNGIAETRPFGQGFDRFMEVRYLNKYGHFTNIVYGLGQICKKLNLPPFTDYQKEHLIEVSQHLESFIQPTLPALENALQSGL